MPEGGFRNVETEFIEQRSDELLIIYKGLINDSSGVTRVGIF